MWVAVCVLWVVLIPLSLFLISLSLSPLPLSIPLLLVSVWHCACIFQLMFVPDLSFWVSPWTTPQQSCATQWAQTCQSWCQSTLLASAFISKNKKSTIASWEKYPHSYCLCYNHTPQLVPVITNFTIYGVALVWPARPTPTLPLLLNLKTISWRRERGSSWPE